LVTKDKRPDSYRDHKDHQDYCLRWYRKTVSTLLQDGLVVSETKIIVMLNDTIK